MAEKEFPLLPLLEDAREHWADSYSYKLRCPHCDSTYQ